MRDLLEYITKNLVKNPEAVLVDEQRDGSEVNLVLKVDPEDMGIVIGRSGQTIKAIRRLLTVRAITEQVHVNLSIQEPEGEVRGEPPEARFDETKTRRASLAREASGSLEASEGNDGETEETVKTEEASTKD